MYVNVPNLITLSRLVSVPVVVWLIIGDQFLWAFWVFVAAGISDALDGFIAKHFNAETELGQFLDPIADKALLVSVYLALGHAGQLATWLVILVVFRDCLIVVGAGLFQTLIRHLTVQPLRISKVNTTAQIVLAATVLGVVGFQLNSFCVAIKEVMVYLVAVSTLLSGAAYVVTWSRLAVALEDGD